MSILFQIKDKIDNGRRGKTIELIRENQLVSSLWAIDFRMRVGESPVRTCGIGDVSTVEAFRKQGNARILLEFTNAWMREQGYAMALLFGIPDFYHRFGYGTSLPNVELSFSTTALRDCRKRHRWRQMKPSDRFVCHKLFDRLNRERSGSLCRKFLGDRRFPKPEKGRGPFVAMDSRDRIVGYVVLRVYEGSLRVTDFQAKDMAISETLLHRLGRIARDLGQETVSMGIPGDHPLIHVAIRLGGILRQQWPRNGEGMVRILNLEGTMRSVLGTLNQRLKIAGALESCPALRWVTDLGQCVLVPGKEGLYLDSDRKKAIRIEMTQMALSRLLLGYESVAGLADTKDVSMPRHVLPFLEVLFPQGHPYCWRFDHF